jgi:hypothetical protein
LSGWQLASRSSFARYFKGRCFSRCNIGLKTLFSLAGPQEINDFRLLLSSQPKEMSDDLICLAAIALVISDGFHPGWSSEHAPARQHWQKHRPLQGYGATARPLQGLLDELTWSLADVPSVHP